MDSENSVAYTAINVEAGEDQYLSIINDEGKEVECNVLFTCDCKENGKSYVVYSDDELDNAGNQKLYASVLVMDGEECDLLPVESEEEWLMISNAVTALREAEDEE